MLLSNWAFSYTWEGGNMIHNQALKENHRSFKWRPWVFNFNSHQLCSSTWTLTLFLGTVIPPTRWSRKCEVSPIRQDSDDTMIQWYRGDNTSSLAQGSLKCLHELICTQVGIFACFQFCEPWGGRDGWLVMWNVLLVCAGAGCKLDSTIPELLSTAAPA